MIGLLQGLLGHSFQGCYCPFESCMFLNYSKAHNFGKIHRGDIGLTWMLTFLEIATAQKLLKIDNQTGGHTVWVTTRFIVTHF